jgi:LuxR family maltose regulon positive regulatory protein
VARPGASGVVSRPTLWQRLGAAPRVTVVSAPPGSGKTVLLRSWIREAGLAERAAWVPVGRDERDPQRLWLSVLGALRQTIPGSTLVRMLTAAPDLDGWAITERLLTDLAPLEDRIWLVIDDLHELGADEARRQLELWLMRAPPQLRFVLATRHDVRLGLHRLRLEGELTEIREADLRFTVAEARELFDAAGVELPDSAVMILHERTEGWAAGLRLAALSLAGHPDPERFAAEFSGTERTVAEYLLAEVLERQPGEVRRLLLRTSGLDRINGELADLLTGASGGERMLQDLEEANAFVVSLDAARSWFRYHHLFADLLQLELRRTQPEEVAALHKLAAGWLAGHGYPVEAIRHAQAARDWGLAAGLLADHWPGLYLGGQEATVHALMAGFPARASAADAELAAVAAADELARGSLEAAERCMGLAERGSALVPEGRRRQAQVLLGVVQLLLTRRHGNLRRWPSRRSGCRPWPRPRTRRSMTWRLRRGPAWARSCARLRWLKSATARPGPAGSTRPSRTWNKGSRWRAGSGGPISSSWAWCTGRRSSSTGPFSRGRRSAVGRRSTWPSGTAGPTIRTLATPS